ncbi:MAG TPA: beta-ketoacyl synthase N-terminal-like domain-containing protein, partial [Polyangiaceae bacterium]|nr:beta-ketoacyl synthase N-terminal-like domain-containing protein [Polyangiaceae bacterium]
MIASSDLDSGGAADRQGIDEGPLDAELEVAIVGMAGRFPGARDLREYWQMIRSGASGIRHLSEADLLAAGVARDVAGKP